ncbi:MAG: hypothetical protein RLZZ383_2763 [Pseudomonadota bacterium]|jgi:tight adherence protein B
MTPLALFVLVMVFATVGLGAYGVVQLDAARREARDERMARRLGTAAYQDAAEEDVATLLRANSADAANELLGAYADKLSELIAAADAQQTMTVQRLLFQCGAFGGLLALGGILVGGVMGIILFPIGFQIPQFFLRRQATKRATTLLSQMPDALEMMSRSMQTGSGLVDTFKLVKEEMADPIASEFGRIAEEVKLGRDWRFAMDGLVERNPTIFELRLFVSTLLLQRETGGNMIETLANIAKTIRNRYVFDAKVKAMTSEARTSGYVLAGMPLGVIALIVVANAEYLSPIFTTSIGNMILISCSAMYAIGVYAMNFVSEVEV